MRISKGQIKDQEQLREINKTETALGLVQMSLAQLRPSNKLGNFKPNFK